jgi:hypothetical protein
MSAAVINTYTAAVIYRVTVKATGETFYAMPTSANDGTFYHVKAQHGKLVCNCPDATYRHRNCKHILALADHLREKRAASIIHQAEQIAAKATTFHPTKDNAFPARYSAPECVSLMAGTPAYLWKSEDHDGGYLPRDYYQHAYR